jgi:hypothetical protein
MHIEVHVLNNVCALLNSHDDGYRMHLWNVGILRYYTALYPRRHQSFDLKYTTTDSFHVLPRIIRNNQTISYYRLHDVTECNKHT